MTVIKVYEKKMKIEFMSQFLLSSFVPLRTILAFFSKLIAGRTLNVYSENKFTKNDKTENSCQPPFFFIITSNQVFPNFQIIRFLAIFSLINLIFQVSNLFLCLNDASSKSKSSFKHRKTTRSSCPNVVLVTNECVT